MFKNLKSNLLIFLFALPFAGVGLGFLLLSVLPSVMEWQEMKSWQAVPATILRAELEVHSGDDSVTYKVLARYRYELDVKSYEHDRVAINTGADNIGDFHQTLNARLTDALNHGELINAWVDPQNPAEAILNRDLRWELLTFSMIFVLAFGGVGLGLMTWALIAKAQDTYHPESADKPWLSRREWASNTLAGNAKAGVWGLWIFTALWNLISSFLWFVIPEELGKGNYLILLGAIFPLVGLGMLYGAINKTLEWRRFGDVSLTLDPYPGAIGGHVGGILELPLAFSPEHQFPVILSCVHSYETGSGKNRSRQETIKWQEQGFAYTEPSIVGTRLQFRFDVPEDLPPSEPPANAYYFWRLRLTADLPGVDLDRHFELPVFATAQQSRLEGKDSPSHPLMEARQTELIESILDMQQVQGGVALVFPMFRHLNMKLGWMLFGTIFAGAGIALWFSAAPALMAIIFAAIGGVTVLSSLYSLFNSLYIRLDRNGLLKIRKLLGIVIKQEFYAANHIAQLYLHQSYSMQSGSEKIDMFVIKARTNEGKQITIGESLKGRSAAQQALEAIGIMSGYTIEK